MGLGGVEPPTSRLSGVRSNHLSYRPGDLARAENILHPRAGRHPEGRPIPLCAGSPRIVVPVHVEAVIVEIDVVVDEVIIVLVAVLVVL